LGSDSIDPKGISNSATAQATDRYPKCFRSCLIKGWYNLYTPLFRPDLFAMSTETPRIFAIRTPKQYLGATPEPQAFNPPSREWIEGKWYVTHSTLPLWKDKRNVNIEYELLPNNQIRDTTSYQAGSAGSKVKTLSGINTPPADNPGAFDWRGSGWLKIASSHWELLGYGDLEDGNRWLVTYFSKTLFTPAGLDIYSREKKGLSGPALEGIKESLAGLEAEELKKLVDEFFEVKHDEDEK
jgi:hypothetical protein